MYVLARWQLLFTKCCCVEERMQRQGRKRVDQLLPRARITAVSSPFFKPRATIIHDTSHYETNLHLLSSRPDCLSIDVTASAMSG